MSIFDELEEIIANKKELLAREKVLKAKAAAAKYGIKQARAIQADCRRDIKKQRSLLKADLAKITQALSDGQAVYLLCLTDDIIERSSALASSIRKFSESITELDEV